MTRHALLNNQQHQHLRVRTERSAALGDNHMFVPTFVAELRSVQAHYPVFFQKHPQTGDFQPVALFGFQSGENLFLTESGWDADYLPMLIERQPFLIGYQANPEVPGGQDRVIHIDLDSPRVNEQEGQALFLEFGGTTEYLQRIGAMLEAIHHGMQDNQAFVQSLLTLGLLETFSLDIQLDNGARNQMLGFYTINEDKLATLDGNALTALHEKGFLMAIYMILASHSKLRDLIHRKNLQLEGDK
ncbi:SapC family protein [Aliiglaciecola sp. CAU 1673]|uniref:SapC family protein n=1 Tax=Aliiglaciecola sp. CAU 1673 TaxID=3032595 RepID=UPI0023DAB10F|nr:SapC family protein [Aliiglaciecola sp. CAU 1673]MDF2178786.1 SapC family protein [Aliiglaciecola sp. CAU 1673]